MGRLEREENENEFFPKIKMVLYTADISKLAVPVKSVQNTRKKAKEPQPEQPKEELKVEPKKRKLTKKQLAAAEEEKQVIAQLEEAIMAEEPPKKKRGNKKAQPQTVQPSEPVKLEPVQLEPIKEEPVKVEPVKEEPVKPKRTRKRVQEPTPSIDSQEEKQLPKPKKVRRDPTEAPQWFQKYIETVKKEEAVHRQEKVPAKQIKSEAQEQAQKSWNDGFTRDRVTNEIDNHSNLFLTSVQNVFPNFCKTLIVCSFNK